MYTRSLYGPLFFVSRDLHAAEVADNVLAHVVGVPTS